MASQISFVLLLWMISVVTPQVVRPLYPISGTASSRSDDGSSPRINLLRPFFYFGRMYGSIYVNHNGHLTFDNPLSTHSPSRFPLHGPRDFIAPFWTDLDNREIGQVYYNQYTSGSVIQQATRDIRDYFPNINFNANWVFVATWYEVAYYPNSGTRTTVQAVLISGGQFSFMMMNYGIIASTTKNVQAGYDTINSVHHFTIPGSFSNAATGPNSNFRRSSNVNVPGRWAFRTDHGSTDCTFNGQSVQLGDSFWSDSTCAQKCTCTSTGLRCQGQPCTFSQICQPTDFQFTCQTVQRGTCTISGDPHYYTFDNSVFHFQGTCTYVLSEQCGGRGLPYYRVEGKNEHRGSTRVSWTRLVKVYVYNDTIELVKGRRGQAKVNGNFVSTPITLSNGTVQVYESGFSVIISANFGLEVSYDTNHYVRISLPYNYQNATCGLCGNFNNRPEDDFRTREGELVSSDVVFANSWQAAGDDEPGCEAQCAGLDCAACTEEQTSLYNNNAHCGILQNSSGPFAACHGQHPPQSFVDSCVYDLCVGDGYQPILCQALNSYASQCQQSGVQLPSWRRQGFCEIPCPANSHFETQGTGCPATCVNPNSTHNCPLPAQESCICDSGFILSGGVCVPHAQCGCSFEGRYYRSGESVILDNDCGRRCSCSHGSMTCQPHGCGPLESCRVEEGERGCTPNSYGTCWTRGPGSYHTFDGVAYQYPGACRLTLAKVMGLSSHPHFMVTAEKVPRGQQGFARLLKFEAEGTQISIEMTGGSKVWVDGQRVRLPFSSASNRIQIYHSSIHSIILRTSFGVTVQTVWPHFVRVTAPSVYIGSLGGLCGNYNGHPHDDFRTPNGILVNSSQDFGDSWRDGSLAAHCVESVNNNSTTNYNSSEFCGILSSPIGPFTQCWAMVDPREHVDACVDILTASTDPASALCEALRDYALICQQRGVTLGDWRNATDCEQSCPLNSHYEVCGSSCPSACPSLSFPFVCDTVCQEGCQCDDGFVLNGNECVPPTACGCHHNGRYWQSGEQFWDGEECQNLCTCDGTTGFVHCSPNSCGPQESCRVVEGEYGCHPSPHGSCSASGDPHYLTFDGKAYDFQGTCRYVLARPCNSTDGLHQFSVEAKNEAWRGLPVSVTAEVFVNVWGYDVHMSRERRGVVQVNGENRNLPILLNEGHVSVYASGSRIFVSADFGLTVTYDGYSTVFISVPANYSEKTCGLCGNFNGNPNDEFHTPSGMMVTTPDEFGRAWKVEGDYTCSDGCGSSCPQCTNELPARAQCEVIQAADGPLSFCHEHVDPAPYFNDCVFDVCVSGNEGHDLLCTAIQTYVSACQSANVQIYPWRQNTTCRLDCPANSHYELCATDCGHTCASSTDATCEQVCSEGCFCDEGFVRSGTRCVPVENCGCLYDGFYYNAGQSYWTEGCTQRCECHGPDDLRCSAASCSSTQQCTIRNGQLGCFDDLSTCTVWGDPHYITFDHKSYDFQGTCRYVLSTLCNDTDGLHSFSVEAKNEPWRGLTVAVTAEVFVNVWGYEVHMSRESHGVVKVNGVTRDLPVLLNGSHVSIYGSGSHTYLSADFGLNVKFDGLYTVYISVPSSYRGKMCGLCGNFNGNPNDEFHTPSGMMVTTPDEFGRAWKVEGDYTCSDGCGSSCPQCTNELPARAQCEVIQATDGPLSFCHSHVDPEPYFRSCVFDVCIAGIDSLCGAIQTYVSACQSANVQIYPWRQNTTCRLDCPANSHYELCDTDCGHTCASSNDATCEQVCSEGCFCDEGFFRSGTRCVPVESCGCLYDGFYHKAGQSFWTEGCTQRCECHGPDDLRCSAASCSSTQQCTIRNGQLGCFDDLSTCTVWGDPHYITFDHKSYDFQGTCRYVLATLCNDTDGLHSFSVEAKNEPWRGLTVAVTAEVFVNVWGYEVHMSRESHGVVKVNGVTTELPVLLNGSHVSIYGSGSHTYLSADFGLNVKFDGLYTVYISVPSSYRGKMCGLCGNFNGNPNDEFHTPSGMMVTTPDEFGRAWKVEGDYTCSDGCGSSCPQCTNELPARAQCEVIQATDGPLSFCHSHVDPEPYFRSCVFDVCIAGIDSLCGAIQTYVSACQSANVQIYPWRQNTTCRLDCPANSHYELCDTDCGHTCTSSNDATCEQVCSEGCFCDEGFFRSGTRCVPVESCGCLYDGFYHNSGQSFWTEGCTQRCECHGPNDLRCSASSCTPAQQCSIRDGQLGCFDAMSTCTVWGDPHYITFDGALAHFQGTCSYIITESVSHSDSETQFQVVATNKHRGNNYVSFVSAVDIYLSNQAESLHVRIGSNRKVKVNGSAASLPTTVGTLAQVVRQGSYIVVDAIDLVVQFDGRSTLLVRLGQRRQSKVTGMCGNFNNNPADDKVLPSGTTAQNDNQFGHSWKSNTSQPGCGSTDDDNNDGLNDCPFIEEYSELCRVITNSSGPFSECHLLSDPQPFFTSCVYDLCLYTPANGMLCSAVSVYERTCSVLELDIPNWRSALHCAESDPCDDLDCAEYEWCGQKDGVYGCFCDEHHHRPNNESYDSSITCVSSSGTMSVSRCQLFEAGFHPAALHLRDDSCNGTIQDGRLVFHFNNDDHLCGTILRSNGTHFMYENTIQGDVDSHEDIISRERSIHLHFSCEYPLAQALSMDVGINPVESIVNKRLPSGQGHYHLRMIPYEDSGFQFPLSRNRNIEMEINQRLYIEVQTEGVDERQISTILDSCWATPLNDAIYPVRWDLITRECPNPADGTVEIVQNGISTVSRFSFRMFTFTNHSSIYLHCQVHLCLVRHNHCATHCYPGYHTIVARDTSHHDTAAISLGPLIWKKDEGVKTSSASGQLTSIMTLLASLLTAKTLT